MSSLDTAVSGMDAYNQWMNVIGNNISNQNTVGYKASEVNFANMLEQTMSQGSAGPANPSTTSYGGTNPAQIGMGVKVGSINTDFSEGGLTQTGNNNNMAISGNGFFAVSPNTNGVPMYYTRAGDFQPDSNGNLVDPNGNYLMALTSSPTANPISNPTWAPVNINANTVSIPAGDTITYGTAAGDTVTVPTGGTATITGGTLSSSGSGWTVTGGTQVVVTSPSGGTQTYNITNTSGTTVAGSGTPTQSETPSTFTLSPNGTLQVQGGQTYYLTLADFENPNGLLNLGNNLYQASTGGNQGAVTYSQGGTDGAGSIVQGSLESSNVDLTKEMSNMIEAQTGYNANSKVINTVNGMYQFMLNQV